MTDGLTASDVAVLSGNYGRNDNDGFGGDWGAWIILFLIFGMFGWGGFGGWGGGFGGNGGSAATQADIQRGFDNQAVVTKLDGITQGICSLGYDQLAQMNGINQNISQTGFGIQQAINADTVAGMQNTNALATQLANCCCENREAIAQVRYDMATQACDTRNTIQTSTRDLLENQNSNTRAILDYLCQDKISALQAENQSLKLAASQQAQNAFITANQEAQTAELIRRLGRDCPIPAFVVPNPNGCYGTPVGVLNNGCGYNNGCGC